MSNPLRRTRTAMTFLPVSVETAPYDENTIMEDPDRLTINNATTMGSIDKLERQYGFTSTRF